MQKNTRNRLIAAFCYTIFAVLILPYMVTAYTGGKGKEVTPASSSIPQNQAMQQGTSTGAAIPQNARAVDAELENYIIGVVAAEMPALFETEALKAQAVAARTYALRQMGDGDNPYTDGQAYTDLDALQQQWGANYESYYARIYGAVIATAGEILTYEEEPILAVFHSTSAGYTESSGNVWNQDLPYLISVASIGDEVAPGFETKTTLSAASVVEKLTGLYPDLKLSTGSIMTQFTIREHTAAGYVKTVQVGNLTLTGRQLREALGLRSSAFTIAEDGSSLVFTTKGYGHGAGMSQYGANYLAAQGYTYDQILAYYYQGTNLTNIE